METVQPPPEEKTDPSDKELAVLYQTLYRHSHVWESFLYNSCDMPQRPIRNPLKCRTTSGAA